MIPVVTRFAPSPTGFMHIGGVRTALYAWLFARKEKGTFILRIEDTDKEREVEGSIAHIIESLEWLGLTWDQGPKVGGPAASYVQSERLEIYKKYAEMLIEKGHAYADPYTEEEVEVFRKKAEEEKRPFLYREHRPVDTVTWDGTKPLRFKVPTLKRYVWQDLVRGQLSAGEEALDDFILIKSDGYPTYNFAHIVDDIEMGVTHVMRGEEFISSTPKFLSLYEALEKTPPQFATLPVILGPDGKKKLSKRDGAKDLLEYRAEGYLPEALVNYLALLGWNPGTPQELFTAPELVDAFSIERVHKSGAVFNQEKLDWMNREYIRKLSDEVFGTYAKSFVPSRLSDLPGFATVFTSIIPLLRERIVCFKDVAVLAETGEIDYYFSDPVYDARKLIWKDTSREAVEKHLSELLTTIESAPDEVFQDPEHIKALIWPYAEKEGRGAVLWPMRYALSGKEKSPDPFMLARILGKVATLRRLTEAKEALGKLA